MWNSSNHQPEGTSNQTAHANKQIHVLLVDHESESLYNTARLLKLCQYKVTVIELASAAIQVLTSGKTKFDLVMANSSSPDLHGIKLLQHAVELDLPTILMSVDDNYITTMHGLEHGAFLCIKKPATMEMIQCLWQHVVREKMRLMMGDKAKPAGKKFGLRSGVEIREPAAYKPEVEADPVNDNVDMSMKNKGKDKKKIRPRDESNENSESYDSDNKNNVAKKVCTEWTAELHMKFLNAIELLGEGKCFPKEILELMNVPGLTRMQVASHLQKCRNDKWRIPGERRMSHDVGSDGERSSQSKERKFGSMPRLVKPDLSQRNGVGSSTQALFKTEPADGDNENSGNVHHGTVNSNTPHHQMPNFGHVFLPGPSRATTSHRRHNSGDLFNFPVMDNLTHDFPGITTPGYHVMNMNANQHQGPYHYGPVYTPQQNATAPSMDARSHWSQEKSSFGNDGSDTRADE